MFTGIIEGIGRLAAREPRGGDVRFTFATGSLPWLGERGEDVRLGESIAVNGCCLTVVDFDASSFAIDASNETLALTTLGALGEGAALNLERAMQAHERFGGHIVSGHVDGVAQITAAAKDGDSLRLTGEATSLQALQRELSTAPAIDQARVAEVRQALESGSYRIDPAKIAERMLDLDKQLGG